MDDKKISDDKIVAKDEILSDTQLENVVGGIGTDTGPGYKIPMQDEIADALKKLSRDPITLSRDQNIIRNPNTGSGPG